MTDMWTDYIGFKITPPSCFDWYPPSPALEEEKEEEEEEEDDIRCSAFGEYVPFLYNGPELFV